MAIDYSKMSVYGDTYEDTENINQENSNETGIAEILLPTISNNSGDGGGVGGIPMSTQSLIGDFRKATKDRTNSLTNPNKIQSMFNSGMEMFGMTPQRDIAEMMRSGQVDVRNTSGIPLGIGAGIARILPDKYYNMSLDDQVFTQAMMGYDGPTVFGENSMGNKDPYGLNVRSGLGNYAEAVQESFDRLTKTLTKNREGVTFNKETGEYEGVNADAVNKQTDLIRKKYKDREMQLNIKDDISLINSTIKNFSNMDDEDFKRFIKSKEYQKLVTYGVVSKKDTPSVTLRKLKKIKKDREEKEKEERLTLLQKLQAKKAKAPKDTTRYADKDDKNSVSSSGLTYDQGGGKTGSYDEAGLAKGGRVGYGTGGIVSL